MRTPTGTGKVILISWGTTLHSTAMVTVELLSENHTSSLSEVSILVLPSRIHHIDLMLHPQAMPPFGWLKAVSVLLPEPRYLPDLVYRGYPTMSWRPSLGIILQYGAENSSLTKPSQGRFIKYVWADLKPALPSPLPQSQASAGCCGWIQDSIRSSL